MADKYTELIDRRVHGTRGGHMIEVELSRAYRAEGRFVRAWNRMAVREFDLNDRHKPHRIIEDQEVPGFLYRTAQRHEEPDESPRLNDGSGVRIALVKVPE